MAAARRHMTVPSAGWRVAGAWVLGGVLTLALGVLVYWADRRPGTAVLIPPLQALSGLQLFGALGHWLPSFVHPLAFSLFTAAALWPRRRWASAGCLFWLVVNVVFEVGQHPHIREALAKALHQGLGDGPLVRACATYFQRGTFDPGDLIAAALGATLAALVLRRTSVHLESHHDR